MQDQVAQVKSSLLLFPEVTLEALGEDEITLDSVLRGKFAPGRSGFACLACGPHLEIVNSVTGERLSAYRFSGVTEQPPTVLAVKEFSWQKREGLLVGIEEVEGSVLCLYDLGLSRVVKAVVLPGRVLIFCILFKCCLHKRKHLVCMAVLMPYFLLAWKLFRFIIAEYLCPLLSECECRI